MGATPPRRGSTPAPRPDSNAYRYIFSCALRRKNNLFSYFKTCSNTDAAPKWLESQPLLPPVVLPSLDDRTPEFR